MAGIWIYAEEQGVLLQLLTAAKDLAKQVKEKTQVITVCEQAAGACIAAGADHVIVLKGDVLWEEDYQEPLVKIFSEETPRLILLAGTLSGKTLAAGIAAKMGSALVNTTFPLTVAEQGIQTRRMMYGGLAICTEEISAGTVVTIEPRVYEEAVPVEGSTGTQEDRCLQILSAVESVETKPIVKQGKDLALADTIICVGRGLSSQEDMKLAESLAEETQGAIGCTRSIAEDYHWLPAEAYIGLSGQKVKPELYLSFGVSGQIQHVAGIRDAKVIVAIDKNENAPIFTAADYGIVGDLHEIIPELIKKLAK